MILRKQQLALLVSILLCFFASSIQAQSAAELTPWTIGLTAASSLKVKSTQSNRSIYTRIGISTSYRFSRWLELNAQLQYHYAVIAGQTLNVSDISAPNYSFTHQQTAHLLSLSLGPNFLLRLGQGDLNFGIQFSGAVNYSKLSAVRSDGVIANIYFLPGLASLQQLELGYTYWPTTRLGIKTTIHSPYLSLGKGRGVGFLYPEKVISDFEFPENEIFDLEYLIPRRNELPGTFFVGVSFKYRIGK